MKNKYRSVFISDVHLGTRNCKAKLLDKFLHDNSCNTLYLVGDIIDWWRMRNGLYWPQKHSNVIRRFLSMARKKTQIIYIIGNHDEFLEDFLEEGELTFGHIVIKKEAIHFGVDGKKYYVVHGDKYDLVIKHQKWMALFGDRLYDWLQRTNLLLNKIRRKLGLKYWSLAKYIKISVKGAISIILKYENAIVKDAEKGGFDGVICGHVHYPDIKNMGNVKYIKYINCGDWVDSCSAVVENHDGTFNLVKIENLEED